MSESDAITSQPESINDLESSKIDEKVTYEKTYRTGNFGVTLGKLNLAIGKKWNLVHVICSVLMVVLTISGSIIFNVYNVTTILKSLALGFSWSTAIISSISAISSTYVFQKLDTIKCPYANLMTMRFLAIINCIVLIFTIIFAGIVLGIPNDSKVYNYESHVGLAVKTNYALLMLLYITSFISSSSLTFSVLCSVCCDAMSCCGNCCIYNEGEELAPGVPDPPSHDRWALVVDVLSGFKEGIDRSS